VTLIIAETWWMTHFPWKLCQVQIC